MNTARFKAARPAPIPSIELLALKAGLLRSLGHPIRLAIVEALRTEEHCVCELNDLFPAERTTISKHLSILKQAGVVSDRKAGLRVYYRLEVPCILSFLGCLEQAIAERTQRQVNALGYPLSPAPKACCERPRK